MNFGPPFYDINSPRPDKNEVLNDNFHILNLLVTTANSFIYEGLDKTNNRNVILILKKLVEKSRNYAKSG